MASHCFHCHKGKDCNDFQLHICDFAPEEQYVYWKIKDRLLVSSQRGEMEHYLKW
jgi:hypothetical protein